MDHAPNPLDRRDASHGHPAGKDELYALDISDVTWLSAPGTEEAEERVEIAHLPGGGVAMRSSLDPDTVLRYYGGGVDGVRPGRSRR